MLGNVIFPIACTHVVVRPKHSPKIEKAWRLVLSLKGEGTIAEGLELIETLKLWKGKSEILSKLLRPCVTILIKQGFDHTSFTRRVSNDVHESSDHA